MTIHVHLKIPVETDFLFFFLGFVVNVNNLYTPINLEFNTEI